MGEVECQYLRVIGELMGRKGRVVNVSWTRGSVSALDCGVCARLISSASGCWKLCEARCIPVCSAAERLLHVLSYWLWELLVPSGAAEWRVFTSTGMQLESRPEAGSKKQVGETSSGCVATLAPVTVFPAQVEEVGISYFLLHFIFLLIGFKRSICLVSS